MRIFSPLLAFVLFAPLLHAQEQIDKSDATAKAGAAIKRLTLRVRATQAEPASARVRIAWRRGGEGLGGTVTRGGFMGADQKLEFALNEWSVWTPLAGITPNGRGWDFPSIVVEGAPADDAASKSKAAKAGTVLSATAVEFEFAEDGKVFKRFTEAAPKGATVGFAFPGFALGTKVTPEFIAQLNGLATHARARRETLEKHFAETAPMPRQFGIIGHLAGYGEGKPGLGGGSGYGVRHCNPAILADECRTLQMLGVNGMVGGLRLADAAGFGEKLRRVYWGGPGSGSPMGALQKGARKAEPEEGCPFDPALPPLMAETTERAIADHRAAGARESWALWVDEIGVFAKGHIAGCDRCAEKFRDYLRTQKLTPSDFGKSAWNDVKPFDLWNPPPGPKPTAAAAAPDTLNTLLFDDKKSPPPAPAPKPAATKGKAAGIPAPPLNAADSLRSYYTYRFMTHATAQAFPASARKFKDAGIFLYAMQGPTPSWSGASLDWHEFYDHGANTAFVFETSNRDARVWQWESYLADIGRGITARHAMPMGCLVKPHRGAPAQRMLSLVSRGARVIEWYTYGPDYAKGDSFSQSPELLERVARAARFLGKAEEWLYGARFAAEPEVAFVSPRSTEFWGAGPGLGVTAFENAKWVYLALNHAHIPVDILSEQQLAEGKLDRFKAIYIPGTNLRRDAAAAVKEWVRAGGALWTDASGLARDEANQPATPLAEVLGLRERTLESWGHADGYRATDIKPFAETNAPTAAAIPTPAGPVRPVVGREKLQPDPSCEVLARFADGGAAITRHRFGKGSATVAGIWSGLTYSAKVRRSDFSMREDFDAEVRALIAATALDRGVRQPARPSEPLVEAVALDKDGRRSVALINWAYQRPVGAPGKGELQSAENLRVDLAGLGAVKSVRSLTHGPLALEGGAVRLPKLAEIDLLIVE